MRKIFSKNLLLFVLLLILAGQGRVIHAQSNCDPATGQQCNAPPAPTCGQPGQPPCDEGGGSGSDSESKPKPTKTSPPPTPTFTPTATATSTTQPATLPPRPTEPSLTPTEAGTNPYARQQSTAIPYAWTIYPTRFGGLGNSSRLLLGIFGALIVIGILWFVRAQHFADASVRENPLINEQFQNSNGAENFAKIESSGSHNFMKEVFKKDTSE